MISILLPINCVIKFSCLYCIDCIQSRHHLFSCLSCHVMWQQNQCMWRKISDSLPRYGIALFVNDRNGTIFLSHFHTRLIHPIICITGHFFFLLIVLIWWCLQHSESWIAHKPETTHCVIVSMAQNECKKKEEGDKPQF